MTILEQLACFARMETPRLWLRPIAYEDVADFHTIVSCPGNMSFIYPTRKNLAESRELLVHGLMKEPLGIWAIEAKESHQMIGVIRLEKIQVTRKEAEVGYFLHKDYWNQGLMTEALEQVSQIALAKVGLRRLLLTTHLENEASQAVAKKVGYMPVRRYKGSDRYSHQTRCYIDWVLDKEKRNERGEK